MQRLFDIILGLLTAPFLILAVAVLAIIIKFKDKNPVFFYQRRIGKRGREFICVKLTTLVPTFNEADILDKTRNAQRFTRFGLWMRNRGLDELPQVFNILKGEMSFIGPRPLYYKSLEFIIENNPTQKQLIDGWRQKRAQVLPGLSGWHQIHSLGPGILKYDMEYLNNPSLGKKLQVFLVSIWIMLVGKERYFSK